MPCHATTDPISPAQEESSRDAESIDKGHQREQLILEHLPQVSLIVRRIKARLPVWVNEDDLYAVGIVGLIAAVDRYRPEHQTSLRTYAEHKIRSAILDSLRALDWATRTDRQQGRLLDKAQAVLEQKHQRPPTQEEVARELGLSLPQYHAWRAAVPGLTLESLEATVGQNASTLGDFLADSAQHWPSEVYERADQEEAMRQALASLPERERTVLHLYYYEERSLAEIAVVLSLHESRVSQIKRRAVQKLRPMLGGSYAGK